MFEVLWELNFGKQQKGKIDSIETEKRQNVKQTEHKFDKTLDLKI